MSEFHDWTLHFYYTNGRSSKNATINTVSCRGLKKMSESRDWNFICYDTTDVRHNKKFSTYMPFTCFKKTGDQLNSRFFAYLCFTADTHCKTVKQLCLSEVLLRAPSYRYSNHQLEHKLLSQLSNWLHIQNTTTHYYIEFDSVQISMHMHTPNR